MLCITGTPSGYVATPSPSGYTPSPTSAAPYGTPSPLGYSPMTPGAAPSPYNPHTPGAGLDQPTASQSEWQTTDIEVRIRDTHDDAGLSGQTGVIRGISVSWLFSFLFYKESSSVIRNIENRALRWCGHID